MWGTIISASSVVAQFRRGFSTTSALTYPFPPRTAVMGMIGAILGANKKTKGGLDLLRQLDNNLLVGVRWIHGRIATFGINNMYGKEENKKGIKQVLRKIPMWADANGKGHIVHLPTPTEFVLYPKYEITLLSEDKKLLDEIATRIKERRMVFAPYLGVQGALARVDLVTEPTTAEEVQLDANTEYTVPDVSAEVYPGENVFVAIFPRRREYGGELRKVQEYSRIYWTVPGKNVKIIPKEGVWKLDGRIVPAY